ncbi:MAG: hypothetical protein KGZ25_07160 [Planctomycetes bacterium]|nr:hypothetical protein [Planctomycetota bacterium]
MTEDIDVERIQQLISSMRESVSMLCELAELEKGEFNGDRHKQSSAASELLTRWKLDDTRV